MRQQVTSAQPFVKVLADRNFRAGESSGEPTLLFAVSDSETRNALAVIVRAFALNARWVSSTAVAQYMLESREFAACVCGFSPLDGGTYLDLARCVKRQSVAVPLIMVSSPRPAHEYQDYLASMKAGAFDFICYPYERTEVARILRRAVTAHYASARTQLV